MTAVTNLDCFVGSTTGALKVVDLKTSKFRNVNALDGLKPKEDGVVAMCFADTEQYDVLVAQRNGHVKVYSTVHDTYTQLFDARTDQSDLIGIQKTKGDNVVTADANGHIRTWSVDGECLSQMEAGDNLQCLQVDPLNVEVAASGGRENQLKLWDLEKGVSMFTARNVKDSGLSLRVPVWVANARFVNESKQICTTTGHHQLRLYDPKAQRKPVMELKWCDSPILTLATCNRESHVLAGNTRGELALFDLRGTIRPIQKYKGFAGSIRSIHAHPTQPYFAACGIDRFLHVYNIETRKQMNKIYCKTRLQSVLLKSV